jgi:hypothetical protein
MNVINRLKNRHERRIDAKIELQAKAAAEMIITRVNEGEEPPFRFNANHSPASIRGAEYSARVGNRAVVLAGAEITCPVIYDHEASLQQSNEFDAIRPYHIASGTLPTPPGTIVIFSPARNVEIA